MKRIVVGQRGWVWVGDYSQSLDEIVLENARCIRRWGTNAGLGQLAAEGPKTNTQLDAPGTVRLHRLSVVATYDCNEKAWAKS